MCFLIHTPFWMETMKSGNWYANERPYLIFLTRWHCWFTCRTNFWIVFQMRKQVQHLEIEKCPAKAIEKTFLSLVLLSPAFLIPLFSLGVFFFKFICLLDYFFVFHFIHMSVLLTADKKFHFVNNPRPSFVGLWKLSGLCCQSSCSFSLSTTKREHFHLKPF